MKKNKKIWLWVWILTFSLNACATHKNAIDVNLPGFTPFYKPNELDHYTQLDPVKYQQVVQNAQQRVKKLIEKLANEKDTNTIVRKIAKALTDTPYLYEGAMGEGDWLPTSLTYQSGGLHVKQDPVYRLDGLDCQTYLQVTMALLHAKTISQFEKNLISIAYGAAEHTEELVHYFNRNNFIDGDFNPINQKRKRIIDVTTHGPLSQYVRFAEATLTRQSWFNWQLASALNVRILNSHDAESMLNRFKTQYAKLHYPNFDFEKISLSYIPKTAIAVPDSSGFHKNESLLQHIPVPAVVEIVRDVKKWFIGGKNIKEIIGSELTISHVGLLYREKFKKGEIIYQKINCHLPKCDVTPIICQQKECSELMFTHATNAYPKNYFWYPISPTSFACSNQIPQHPLKAVPCNRVQSQPLFTYLTSFQNGEYIYMNNESILGLHIEKLN